MLLLLKCGKESLCLRSAIDEHRNGAVGEHLDGLAAEHDCGHLPSACDAITIRSHPWLASRRAIFRPLASHHTHRATLAVQIPIAEPAARPTARAARDFVPWRFSDAAHLSRG
jgi:hypothetical protein